MKCRICEADVSALFVDLGSAPPSNSFLTQAQLSEPEIYFPLKVFVCDRCKLVQIDECKKSGEIFNREYAYFSSVSRSWVEHARRYADSMTNRLQLGRNSLVVEVASNDGYLLQFFQQAEIPCLGVEPTHSTAIVAKSKGIEVIENFFGLQIAKEIESSHGAADLIVCNNVLAHVPGCHDFVAGLSTILKPSGSITVEFPHLLELIRHAQFDTIYHEHFSYFSLATVCALFTMHGLQVYDVEKLPTHGGSLRVFSQHIGGSQAVAKNVELILAEEHDAGMETAEYYEGFQPRVDAIKDSLLMHLLEQKKAKRCVVGYGAAAKGNTLFNYCGVRRDFVNFVADAAASKQGKFLPGSHIPVVAEERIRERKPENVLILPWNIEAEIISQLSYIREWGGKFSIAVPRLRHIQ